MITIYHNPRCRKSREGLEVLQESGQDFKLVRYLDEPLGKADLKALLGYLEMEPIALVRTNEAIWKSEFKGKDLSGDAIIEAMVKYPQLIERPIVVRGNKAVVGRPSDNIRSLLGL